MKNTKPLQNLMICLGLCAVAVMCAGCPWMRDDGVTKVTTLLSAGEDPLKSTIVAALLQKADLPIDDIASLTVTVSQISLVPEGDEDAEQEQEQEQEGEEKANESHIFLFDEGDEPIVVDLKNLMSVSEVLSSAEIPAGSYNQIRLEISDPELVLVGSEEVITDIHLTANSRLFVTQKFEIEGGAVLLELSLDDLHLVVEGNGSYNLTPQLQATLDITSADAYAEGTILEIDTVEPGQLTLQLANGDELSIAYTGATVTLPGDPDPIAGTTADLAVGQQVQVTGTVWLDGSFTATAIVVLPEPEPVVEDPPTE